LDDLLSKEKQFDHLRAVDAAKVGTETGTANVAVCFAQQQKQYREMHREMTCSKRK